MTSEGAFGQEGLIQNDFVEKVMADPSEDKDPMTVFEGLLGKSTRPDALRLYFGSELDLHLEFQFQEDDMKIETIPKELTGRGFDLQKVWMRPDTSIEVVARSRDLRAVMTAELLDILLFPQPARWGHRNR
jgi:hypothetical protein